METGLLHKFQIRKSWRVALGLVTVYLLWGSTYLGIKYAIHSIPPYLMSSTRFIIAGTILYLWAKLQGAPQPRLTHWRSAAIIGGFLLLGGNASVAWAEQYVPSSIASLIIATMPLWMVLQDWLLFKNAPPNLQIIAGLILGFVGIALLVRPTDSDEWMAFDPIGIIALLVAALFWSFGSLYSRKATLPKSQIQSIAMQMIAGGSMVLIAGLLRGEWKILNFSAISFVSVAAWLYLILFGSMVGFSTYIWLLKNAPTERVATYAYVNPVVAVFLGWFFLNEPISIQTLFASGIIIISVFLIINRRRNIPAPPQLPCLENTDNSDKTSQQ
jgi:drug/metabolite transporter (DMT)-like permease